MRRAVSSPDRGPARGGLSRGLVFVLGLAAMLLALLAGANAGANRADAKPAPSPTGSKADFERARFANPTTISNRWLPLRPGTQRVYEGSAIPEGGPKRPARRVAPTPPPAGHPPAARATARAA